MLRDDLQVSSILMYKTRICDVPFVMPVASCIFHKIMDKTIGVPIGVPVGVPFGCALSVCPSGVPFWCTLLVCQFSFMTITVISYYLT